MKKVLLKAWLVLCIILSLSYCIASLSAFISPVTFSFITFFVLIFPLLLIVQIIFCIVNFYISKKMALVMLLILPLGWKNTSSSVAFHLQKNWQPGKQKNSIRVLTWNVENFVNLDSQSNPKAAVRVKMLKLITEYHPDVICFQEYKDVENGKRRISAKKELDSIGYIYNYCSNDVLIKTSSRIVIGGVAVYSKLPLINSGAIKIRTEYMNESLVFTDVMLQNKPLRVYTAHLASYALYPQTAINDFAEDETHTVTLNKKGSVQQKLKETEILHQQQVQIIKNTLQKSPYPIVYCGDINATPASYNYYQLKENLQDAFLEKGSGIGATFYKILPTLRIDVCFADTAFKVIQCKVINKKLSDHYPVITDLSWK